MTDALGRVDAEIRRLADEIAAIERTATISTAKPVMKVPDYSEAPALEAEIPKGFRRAPITHAYDPSKAERLALAEAELRDALLGRNRQDAAALLSRIYRHQAAHPIVDKSAPSVAHQKSNRHDPVRERVLSNLIGSR
jgi:hypothetical protein